jgi:hypothetical protein
MASLSSIINYCKQNDIPFGSWGGSSSSKKSTLATMGSASLGIFRDGVRTFWNEAAELKSDSVDLARGFAYGGLSWINQQKTRATSLVQDTKTKVVSILEYPLVSQLHQEIAAGTIYNAKSVVKLPILAGSAVINNNPDQLWNYIMAHPAKNSDITAMRIARDLAGYVVENGFDFVDAQFAQFGVHLPDEYRTLKGIAVNGVEGRFDSMIDTSIAVKEILLDMSKGLITEGVSFSHLCYDASGLNILNRISNKRISKSNFI